MDVGVEVTTLVGVAVKSPGSSIHVGLGVDGGGVSVLETVYEPVL